MTSPETGRYAVKGAKLPLTEIFKDLTDMWQEKEMGTFRSLARGMSVTPNVISMWRNGTQCPAPWWAILYVCEKLKLEIRVKPDRVIIVRTWNKKT